MRDFSERLWSQLEPALLVDPTNLLFLGISETAERIECAFGQQAGGVPVEGASLSVEFLRQAQGTGAPDQVTILSGAYFPDVVPPSSPRISREEAWAVAEMELPDSSSRRSRDAIIQGYDDMVKDGGAAEEATTLVINPIGIPMERPRSYEYRLCWKVRINQVKTYFVDAHTGRIVDMNQSIKRRRGN